MSKHGYINRNMYSYIASIVSEVLGNRLFKMTTFKYFLIVSMDKESKSL